MKREELGFLKLKKTLPAGLGQDADDEPPPKKAERPGGFMEFQSQYPELCEGAAPGGGVPATPGRGATARLSLTSLSQPCLPLSNSGPTRILPFLYLGSQADALDFEVLKRHGIHNVLNLSVSCPRPDFLAEENFLRIPVLDNYNEKLLPHFEQAFAFLDAVARSNSGAVLVHCLAGISRSPTMAIAYIMRHLHMSQEEAYRYIKEKRPSISPNFNFLGQLLDYEKQLQEARRSEVAKRLSSTRRKVLVQPPTSPAALSARPVMGGRTTSTLTRALSLEGSGAFKRSFSCPVRLIKLDEEEEGSEASSLESSGSSAKEVFDTSVQTPSPVRTTAELSATVERPAQVAFAIGAPPSLPRPGGLGGLPSRRPMRIPSAVQEDLPSPSTELSKLTFTTALAAATPKVSSESAPGAVAAQMDMEVDEEAVEAPQSSDSAFVDVSISPEAGGDRLKAPQSSQSASTTPTGPPAGLCAANPIFAAIASCRSSTDSAPPNLGCDAPASAPTSGGASGPAPVPLLRLDSNLSSPPVTQQPPSAASTSAENPMFLPSASSGRGGASKRAHWGGFFGGGGGKKPHTSGASSSRASGRASTQSESDRGRNVVERIGNLLKRSSAWRVPIFGAAPIHSGSRASSLSGGFLSGYFVNGGTSQAASTSGAASSAAAMGRSQTTQGLAARQKSRSEDPLKGPTGRPSGEARALPGGPSTSVESPESGFVETNPLEGPAYRDPERESISSASSLEIPVQ